MVVLLIKKIIFQKKTLICSVIKIITRELFDQNKGEGF